MELLALGLVAALRVRYHAVLAPAALVEEFVVPVSYSYSHSTIHAQIVLRKTEAAATLGE